jgi:hypothetical protein
MAKIADAVDHARALLELAQQPPPEKLTATLKRAIQGWDDGRSESARLHLERALQLAQRLSYL